MESTPIPQRDIKANGESAFLQKEFFSRSEEWQQVDVDTLEFAKRLDEEDDLKDFRKLFHYPKRKNIHGAESFDADEECIYLCGQSLGLQLKCMKREVDAVLDNWAMRGVECHFVGDYPALFCDQSVKEKMATLVGAEADEIAFMNGLTVNIHFMLASFYKPTPQRHKILMITGGFHSDWYALQSHVEFQGYDPEHSLILLKPKEGEHTVDCVDVVSAIEREGSSIALVYIEGVHYYTGQLFDLQLIARVAHQQGCRVGYDLAHAVGNVPLHLHDWDVDFAVWCTYKYLNSGAGSLGVIFCHNKLTEGVEPALRGWWGLRPDRKFAFDKDFTAAKGADRFKLSNPSPVLCAMVSTSLDVFLTAGMDRIQRKQKVLTGYLEYLLEKNLPLSSGDLQLITPHQPRERGSQLSLLSSVHVAKIEASLKQRGIVCDIRSPSVLRITPAPLYNTFQEVYKFVHIFKDIWNSLQTTPDEQS